jgi:2-oxoglutarate ferredoxin oxidoreductase subunit gamma
MQQDIIFSGFGGQGALFAGQLLAYAAMDAGKHVTWIPSYGPEIRGGTAHCVVIISDEEIGSPLVRNPANVVALNNPSVEKYEPLLAANGNLIYNSSLTSHVITRRNIYALPIPASDIAAELGHAQLLNMIMLGALIDRTEVLPLEAIDQALNDHIPAHRRELLELNKLALRRGIEIAHAVLVPA